MSQTDWLTCREGQYRAARDDSQQCGPDTSRIATLRARERTVSQTQDAQGPSCAGAALPIDSAAHRPTLQTAWLDVPVVPGLGSAVVRLSRAVRAITFGAMLGACCGIAVGAC